MFIQLLPFLLLFLHFSCPHFHLVVSPFCLRNFLWHFLEQVCGDKFSYFPFILEFLCFSFISEGYLLWIQNSWLTVLFFKHFEDSTSFLFTWFLMTNPVIQIIVTLKVRYCFSLVAFRHSSFFFSSVQQFDYDIQTMISLQLSCLEFAEPLESVLCQIWEVSNHEFFQYFFCSMFFLLSCWYLDDTKFRPFGIVLQGPKALFTFFTGFFFFLVSVIQGNFS